MSESDSESGNWNSWNSEEVSTVSTVSTVSVSGEYPKKGAFWKVGDTCPRCKVGNVMRREQNRPPQIAFLGCSNFSLLNCKWTGSVGQNKRKNSEIYGRDGFRYEKVVTQDPPRGTYHVKSLFQLVMHKIIYEIFFFFQKSHTNGTKGLYILRGPFLKKEFGHVKE